jgi:hypothetical protein
MRTALLTLLLPALCLLGASAAHATVTVTLKDGSVIRGTLQDVQTLAVTLQAPTGETQLIALSAVAQVVTASGVVVYQGQAAGAAPASPLPASPAPAPTPAAGPAPEAPSTAAAATPTAEALAPRAPAAGQTLTVPAEHDARWHARRRVGLALSWAGGVLAAAGSGLTFAAVQQVDAEKKDRLGTGAAASAGVGLLGIVAGALVLPGADADGSAALLDYDQRQLCLGLPSISLDRAGGPRASLFHATF